MNGTDLDGHSFCCFEAASTASLAAFIEAANKHFIINCGNIFSKNSWT